MPSVVISHQPQSVTTTLGSTVTFQVKVSAGPPATLIYQWRKQGGSLPAGSSVAEPVTPGSESAHQSTLTISNVDAAALGFYFCVVIQLGAESGQTIPAALATAELGTGTASGDGGATGLGNPIYSGAATAFSVFFGGEFSTEGVIFDGDFDTAKPHGMMWPERPFASEGDEATVVCRQRYMQRAALFLPTPLGTPFERSPALLLIDEDDFRHEGGGIVSWQRTYATRPSARDVYESFSYGFQYLVTTGDNTKVTETAFEVTSRVRCEYFHVRDRASYPPRLAPRVLQLADHTFVKRGEGNLAQDSTYGAFIVSPDAEILAEDSKERMWRYPFMERRSRYIAAPTLAFWGSAINIPVPTLPGTT